MKNYLTIIRPFNCLFVGLAILTGAGLKQIQAIRGSFVDVVSIILSGVAIAAGGYVINDYHDLPIDRINAPKRVLPSGRMNPEYAYIYSLILFVVGIVLSFIPGKLELIVLAIVNSFLLYFYAKLLKKKLLIGNLLVAWAAASSFLYGAILTNNVSVVMPILIYTFLYTFAREIVKDTEDVEGDEKFGVNTLAIYIGRKGALIVSILPTVALTYLLYYQYRQGNMAQGLFLSIFILFVIPLIVMYSVLLKDIVKKKIQAVAIITKLHMFILLIVYVWLV